MYNGSHVVESESDTVDETWQLLKRFFVDMALRPAPRDVTFFKDTRSILLPMIIVASGVAADESHANVLAQFVQYALNTGLPGNIVQLLQREVVAAKTGEERYVLRINTENPAIRVCKEVLNSSEQVRLEMRHTLSLILQSMYFSALCDAVPSYSFAEYIINLRGSIFLDGLESSIERASSLSEEQRQLFRSQLDVRKADPFSARIPPADMA